MGYSYTLGPRPRLCCDACPEDTGVRKRTCPHKVHYAHGGGAPTCSAPALCDACWKRMGKGAGIHAECKANAAAANSREAARGEKLRAGELEVRACWGNVKEIPTGDLLVLFGNPLTNTYTYRIVAESEYKPNGYLSDYTTARETEISP